MAKNFQEPEERDMDKNNDESAIMDDFNPLDEPVIEKTYTKHNVKVDPNDFVKDIPEPSFEPPPMTGSLTEEPKPKKEEEPFNPKMNEMPQKDKMAASEKVAEMVMAMYKLLNNFADNKLQFDQRKLLNMQMKGEIDLSVNIPFSSNPDMTAGEFIDEYNRQSKGTIKVSKQFENETLPVLTRVLAKRGIGMTDEQYLAYLFGQDALSKMMAINNSLAMKRDILEQLKELNSNMRTSGYTPPPPQPQPQPVYQAEPEPEPVYRPTFDPNNVNDVVNQMTGSLVPTYEEDFIEDTYEEPIQDEDVYEEPKPRDKKGTAKKSGRGRPKKK